MDLKILIYKKIAKIVFSPFSDRKGTAFCRNIINFQKNFLDFIFKSICYKKYRYFMPKTPKNTQEI